MTTSVKTTKLTLTLPENLHRQVKALASLQGKSLREYVIERIAPAESETDLDDINAALAESLAEVQRHLKGEIELPAVEELIPRRR